MSDVPLSWKIRHRIWAHFETLRFDLAKPNVMKQPEPNRALIELKPFCELYPDLPMANVLVFDRLPGVERNLRMRAIVGLKLFLNRLYPQMQAGLPEIDADIDRALDEALLTIYRHAFRAPHKPDAYKVDGAPNLGDLSVEGPFAIFIERDTPQTLKWDFRFLGRYEHHPELCSLGLRVIFSDPKGVGRPVPQKIISEEFGEVIPGDEHWDRSALLAICAASTHLALTRHFNYVHLISGNHWDVATRNYLPTNHALYALLWPHILNGCYTNYGVTRVQMLPDGDFVNMFSFTHRGLMHYFDHLYQQYDYRMMDPQADWNRRGLGDSIADRPTHDNLVELINVMYRHAHRYVHHYYASDQALREDRVVAIWLGELHRIIPNGIDPALLVRLTRKRLARLLASYIFEGNTIHTLAGTNLWDYQLWADKNPVRVYKDNRRLPLDVYQRVINNNFALQLNRDVLCDNYRDLALDQAGRRLFTRFAVECRRLQAYYDLLRWQSAGQSMMWRMEPRKLNISMNG